MVIRFLISCAFIAVPVLVSGQVMEYKDVLRLPPTINTGGEEGMPLLSPDGKKMFFTRALYGENKGGKFAGQDIWFSVVGNNGWMKASNSFGNINTRDNNIVAGIGDEGKTIYFVDASPFRKMDGIYFIRQERQEWTRPQLIPIPGLDNQDFIGFYVSPDYDVILLSMKGKDSRGKEDLYYTEKDAAGSWMEPKNMGSTLNTSDFEISPFLSADKKRLYFSSNGHGGSGDADIFYSERLYDSWETWSAPVNLGASVNSPKFDAYFSLYGDSVAYFASNRDGRYADLYKVKVTQRRTILAKDQHYLTDNEWNSKVGKKVSRSIVFNNKSTQLNGAQQELLFYIVNKLMLERDIRFHLVVTEEEDAELSKIRLKMLHDHLKQSGIDPIRLYSEQLSAAKKSQKGVIELHLFQ